MKDTYYFSHDSNASQDPKILAMRSVYGWEGYGWYWMFIEMLRDQEHYRLNIEGKYAFNAFALQMQCTEEKTQQFINDCINEFKLFESDGKYFWSNSLLRRMEKAEERSQKNKKAAEKRWNKASNPNAMQTHSECNANKVNENKVNENKTTTTPLPPSQKTEPDFNPQQLESRRREVFNSFEKEFGRTLSPTEYQEITAWLDGNIEGIPPFSPELILHALKQAALNAKRNTGYIRGILRTWHHNGVKSVQDAEEKDRQFQEQKNKARGLDQGKRASPTKCETTGGDYEIYMPPA